MVQVGQVWDAMKAFKEARALDTANGRKSHGYSRAVTYRPRRRRNYKKVGKKNVITRNGVNSLITRRIMKWKAYHHLNDLTVSLTGALTNPGVIYLDYTRIPPYEPSSTDAQQQTLHSSRQSDNVYADRANVSVSCRFTHNHTVAVRFIAFFNNSWNESLIYSGSTPVTQPANLDNLFKGFLTREDEQINVNARIMSNQKFNQDLVVRRKGRSPGLLFDRTYYVSPFQTPSGGSGGDADTQSLRQFNFELPLKMYWQYENGPVDAAISEDMKKGKLILCCLVCSADPSTGSNTGNAQLEFRTSVVFRENS